MGRHRLFYRWTQQAVTRLLYGHSLADLLARRGWVHREKT